MAKKLEAIPQERFLVDLIDPYKIIREGNGKHLVL